MSALLELTPDEVLSTTRCVRRRLDLERPVERELIEECLALAQQAPVASYQENWHFVVVTDPEKRAALGDLWRKFGARYLGERPGSVGRAACGDDAPARLGLVPHGPHRRGARARHPLHRGQD